MRYQGLLTAVFSLTMAALPGLAQQQDPNLNQGPPPESHPATGWRQFNGPQPADAPPPGVPIPPQLTLPAGTLVTVRVNQPLSSDHNERDDAFTGTLAQPVVVDGLVVARRGQPVQGRVVDAQKAGRTTGTSRLGLELTYLGVVDGQQLPVQTQLVERRGGTSIGRDAAAIGTTTGIGAAIGAGAAGGPGAAIGAGAGALASVIGVLTTRGKSTEVYPEMPLTFRLVAPVTISTERAEQAFQPVTQQDYAPTMVRRPAPPAYAGYPPPPPYYGSYYAYPPYPYYWGPSFFFGGGGRFGYRRW